MQCGNRTRNMERCNCTYEGCARHGLCCECLHYHRVKNQLPACYFPADAEKTFNRSLEHFFQIFKKT